MITDFLLVETRGTFGSGEGNFEDERRERRN
jgi:hypothetical protein